MAAKEKIDSYNAHVRRKHGTLLPLEESVLASGLDLAQRGVGEFHGFLVAKRIRDLEQARLLTSHGTLYKALDRMERAGLLASRWEDPVAAADERRPRRRLYRVTLEGARALARARAAPQQVLPRGRLAQS